ncbi:MAG: rhodanese-like domain-containing protein [Alphaproteobacteria bacterium]|nr:rhodanese-like domain-containing protein [Alphaproteobacteria bacterium]MDE2340315.1 rhodanese-like domain-containing protein [Alphaproteobacteria bacterium]
MPVSVKSLLEAANAVAPKISVSEARALIAEQGALLVDVRDGAEVAQSGKLQGALNVSRGMIEFRADNASPLHHPEFEHARPVVLYCASGGRSALSAKVLHDMGYEKVYNIGGFKDAVENGFPTEAP